MRKSRLITIACCVAILVLQSAGFAQVNAYRVDDNRVKSLLVQIETETDRFKRSFNTALDNSKFDGTVTEDNLMEYITEFENATDRLRQRFAAKESVEADVKNVLDRASFVNRFMIDNLLSFSAESDWASLRSRLDLLATYYGVRYDWYAAASSGGAVYTKPYRVDDKSVSTILRSIETRTDHFKRKMNEALDRSTLNNTRREDVIFGYITEFEHATDRLKKKFDAGSSVDNDVEDVLRRAASINAFMERSRLTRASEENWVNLRNDLNTLAGYYNVGLAWTSLPESPATMAYTVAGSRVAGLLTAIEAKSDNYKRSMNTALDRSVLNETASERAVLEYITAFENATDRLKQHFDANESTDEDVVEVLTRASYIDGFMKDYRLLRVAEAQWTNLRTDLETLAGYYQVNFAWDRQYPDSRSFDSRFTGTYKLNPALSDDVGAVVRNAIEVYPQLREERIERNVTRRLSSPQTFALEKNGTAVAIASSIAPKSSFYADGVTRTESNARGNQIKVTGRSYYDGVTLSYEGARANDFYVNFMVMPDNRLRVVRRINIENLDETITVSSIYDKISEQAVWDTVRDDRRARNRESLPGRFAIPNGTKMRAVLNESVSTKETVDGTPFTMRVVSPTAYNGAVISGHVVSAERSGVVSGRANVSLEFDSIRLANGRTYDFAGIIEGVTLANGKTVSVDSEGEVRDNNQTEKTIARTGIGAGIGAIIGAILGGGDGAAIGAAVGGAAGAGTVLAQGRDDVEMEPGSIFEIQATAPGSTVAYQ